MSTQIHVTQGELSAVATGVNTGDQTLSLSGTTLSISGQNSVTLPSGGGSSNTFMSGIVLYSPGGNYYILTVADDGTLDTEPYVATSSGTYTATYPTTY